MTARELFEKLHPVPEGVEWFGNCYCAKSNNMDEELEADRYDERWQGFQAGHAAGLLPLVTLADEFPELNMGNFNNDDVSALNNWGIAIVAAIRAMKDQKK